MSSNLTLSEVVINYDQNVMHREIKESPKTSVNPRTYDLINILKYLADEGYNSIEIDSSIKGVKVIPCEMVFKEADRVKKLEIKRLKEKIIKLEESLNN